MILNTLVRYFLIVEAARKEYRSGKDLGESPEVLDAAYLKAVEAVDPFFLDKITEQVAAIEAQGLTVKEAFAATWKPVPEGEKEDA